MEIKRSSDPSLLASLNEEVQNLHHKIQPKIFKPFSLDAMTEFFKTYLQDDSTKAFIAYDDEPMGYIVLTIRESDEDSFTYATRTLNIDQICIKKEFRKRGIGKALVDFAKAYAEDLDVQRIEMSFWTDNENSGQFFSQQGFKKYQERMSYIL